MLVTLETKLSPSIKVLATVLTASALGLELWNQYEWWAHGASLQGWGWVFAFERFVLIAHGIESLVALVYAASRHPSPLRYSVYTFFVGTIGLIELFRLEKTNE
ncbi:MAG: hypothetical protein O3A14_07770 [Cyanobacteria bacterium]|nr:hypothetical protein [Cyanobacteriota bacterium]